MGMIVDDIVWRIRQLTGPVYAHEWEWFIDLMELEMWRCDLPEHAPAFLHNDCIYIGRGIDPFVSAPYIWHEIGHAILHAGGPLWWAKRPQGRLTVARFERQADDFARLFPVWDDHESF